MCCGPLIAWMVMSVTSQVVKIRLCMGTNRTRCNRRVFSPGGISLFAEFTVFRELCFHSVCFVFQYLGFLCYFVFKIIVPAHFTIPVLYYLWLFHNTNCSYICSCFTIPNSVYLFDKSNFNTGCMGTLSLFSVLDLMN